MSQQQISRHGRFGQRGLLLWACTALLFGSVVCMGTATAKRPHATCTLQLQGQRNTTGIAIASLTCTGGNVRVAVNKTLLGRFRGNFKGVTWDQQKCGNVSRRCLFTVCGNTRAVFRNSIAKHVRGVDCAICVAGKSRVTITDTTVGFNAASGICVIDASVRIAGNTSITHNNSSDVGGGVNVGSRSSLIIGGNVSITHNHALNGSGGGVYLRFNSKLTIGGNASITYNKAHYVDDDDDRPDPRDRSDSIIFGAPLKRRLNTVGEGDYDGGVYAASDPNVTIGGNVSVTQNTAPSGSGGGVYVGSYSNLAIGGEATIAHNTASGGDGGGVCLDFNSSLLVSGNAIITHNTIDEQQNMGGGVYVASNSRASITVNAFIKHNIGEGVFVGVFSNLSIAGNTSITHNTLEGVRVDTNCNVSIVGNTSITYNQKGGVSADDEASVSIGGNASITHNQGTGVSVGGQSSVSIAGNASVTHNTASDGSGGSVYVGADSNFNISGNASITHNNALYGGGGVYVDTQSSLSIAGNALIAHNNVSGGAGGGIYLSGESNLSIAGNTSITHNTVVDDGGGVLVEDNAIVSIANTTSITHNNASKSGGAVHIGSQCTVTIGGGTTITGNNAFDDGGGVYVAFDSYVSISGNASLAHNTAHRGGAGGGMYVGYDSNVSIAGNASIAHNVATGNGGGVCVQYDPNTHALISIRGTVTITHNRAGLAGGGVFAPPNSTMTIEGNVSVTHNNATIDGGGVFVDYDSNTRIVGIVSFMYNTAGGQGGCISLSRKCHAKVSGMLLQGCSAQVHGGGVSVLHSSSLRMQDVTFKDNHAIGLGDDIFALPNVALQLVASNINYLSLTVYWQRSDCEPGEVKAPQRYCEKCPSNMYSLNAFSTSCDLCPPNANCTGGDVLLPLADFWHSHRYSTQMHKCQKTGACLANDTCALGYKGNLCGNCARHFGKVGAFSCGQCRSVAVTVVLFCLAMAVLVLFGAWLVYTTMHDNKQQTRCIRPSDLGKILIRHVQYLLILCGIGLPWPAAILHMRNAMSWFFAGATAQVVSVDCILLRSFVVRYIETLERPSQHHASSGTQTMSLQ